MLSTTIADYGNTGSQSTRAHTHCLSLSVSLFLSAVNMLTRTAGKAQLDKAFTFLMLSITCENFQRIAIEIDYINVHKSICQKQHTVGC